MFSSVFNPQPGILKQQLAVETAAFRTQDERLCHMTGMGNDKVLHITYV